MTAPAAAAVTCPPEPWQLDFVDRAGRLMADTSGLPPSYIQVLAWLIVCEPAHQSVDDLRAALGLSAGAVSMATAALERMGAVERIALPGQRRRYWRIGPGLWERLVRQRVEAMAAMRVAAEAALAHARRPQLRLQQLHDIYAWFESSTAGFIAEQWPAPRAARRRGPPRGAPARIRG